MGTKKQIKKLKKQLHYRDNVIIGLVNKVADLQPNEVYNNYIADCILDLRKENENLKYRLLKLEDFIGDKLGADDMPKENNLKNEVIDKIKKEVDNLSSYYTIEELDTWLSLIKEQCKEQR